MGVDLNVSRELLDHIGRAEFTRHLTLFDATITGEKSGEYPFEVIFILDVLNAPKAATRVVPTFRNDGENGNVSVGLLALEWLDAAGRRIEVGDDRAA